MRYIGNKAKLLLEIEKLLKEKDIYKDGLTFCDLFAGTCTVGNYLKNKYKIIANDTLYMSYATSVGKLCSKKGFFKKLGFDPFDYFEKKDISGYIDGFCYNNFSPTMSGRMYFSDENAKKIDFIRDTIDQWHRENKIADDEKLFLIASLLECVSKVSNVAGVYSAFLKKWDPRAVKTMVYSPIVESSDVPKYKNIVYECDAKQLMKKIKGDILYIDPPYTSTQYISQYHVLETIAKNDKPDTHGVGAHRDNGSQISNWCKKGLVHAEFEKLIKDADFKHIIMSYSDAGIMDKEYIESVLKRYAKPGTFSCKEINFIKYKSTRAVNREIANNTRTQKHFEWLFYIEKDDNPKYSSPLNYIGGKGDALEFLKNNMPNNIKVFYDLFGGGANVAINMNAGKIFYNDINPMVVSLLMAIRDTKPDEMYRYIERQINKYSLQKANKESYVTFRNNYNALPVEKRNPLDLYLLICFGFEHQIRFNSKLEFNNPCGNSGFNQNMLEKLMSFHVIANDLTIEFNFGDYKNCLPLIKKGSFVYCDPPYLNTCGAYNDGRRGFNGWDEEQDGKLRDFLDTLDKKGVKFMLSNMTTRNGIENSEMKKWVNEHGYTVVVDSKITKRNRQNRRELVIINYEKGEL